MFQSGWAQQLTLALQWKPSKSFLVAPLRESTQHIILTCHHPDVYCHKHRNSFFLETQYLFLSLSHSSFSSTQLPYRRERGDSSFGGKLFWFQGTGPRHLESPLLVVASSFTPLSSPWAIWCDDLHTGVIITHLGLKIFKPLERLQAWCHWNLLSYHSRRVDYLHFDWFPWVFFIRFISLLTMQVLWYVTPQLFGLYLLRRIFPCNSK